MLSVEPIPAPPAQSHNWTDSTITGADCVWGPAAVVLLPPWCRCLAGAAGPRAQHSLSCHAMGVAVAAEAGLTSAAGCCLQGLQCGAVQLSHSQCPPLPGPGRLAVPYCWPSWDPYGCCLFLLRLLLLGTLSCPVYLGGLQGERGSADQSAGRCCRCYCSHGCCCCISRCFAAAASCCCQLARWRPWAHQQSQQQQCVCWTLRPLRYRHVWCCCCRLCLAPRQEKPCLMQAGTQLCWM